MGTQGYTAPEVYDFGKYTSKADTWSLGVVLHSLCDNGEPLFFGRANQMKQSIKHETYKNKIDALGRSPEMKNIIKQMVVVGYQARLNEQVRPTVAEFISNP